VIRPAEVTDIPRLIELGRLLHAISSYSVLRFVPEQVEATLRRLIAGEGVVFVAERDGIVVGGFAGAVAQHWFSDELVAFDYSLFVDPQARNGITAAKLVDAFIEWAKLRGARQVCMGITTGLHVERTARFYRALGLQDAGLLFRMEV